MANTELRTIMKVFVKKFSLFLHGYYSFRHLLMNISAKLLENINRLPESKQLELAAFVERLTQTADGEEELNWSDLSLTSAVRGMENKEFPYTVNDLKEVYQ